MKTTWHLRAAATVVVALLQIGATHPTFAQTAREGKPLPSVRPSRPLPTEPKPLPTESKTPALSTTPKIPVGMLFSITSPSPLPSGTPGQQYGIELAASGGQAPYIWSVSVGILPAGLNLSSSGGLLGTPTANGNFAFTVRAMDATTGKPRTAIKAFTLNIVSALTVMSPPTLPSALQGQPYSLTLGASGGTAPYKWSVNTGALPTGLALLPNGLLSGTPTTSGSFSFKLAVQDSAAAPRQEVQIFFVTVSAPGATLPLTVTTVNPVASAKQEQAYSQTFTATGGQAPYTWTYGGGSPPSGLSLSANGVLSGTPTVSGTFSFTLQVKDSTPGTPLKAFSDAYALIVAAPALSITTASALPNAALGKTYSQTLSESGGQAPYTWSVSGGAMPTGLTLSPAGVLSGAPTTGGNYSFTLHVMDSTTGTVQAATKAFTMSVVAALAITTATTLPPAITAQTYSQTLAASGGTPSYQWSIVNDGYGGLPSGFNLSPGGVVSGTTGQYNKYTFTLKVTDSTTGTPMTATQTTTLSVTPPPIVFTTTSLPPATQGQIYSQTLAASGGAPPYKWSSSSGALPAGLTLSPGGVLSGTPTASGNSSVTVQITDVASLTATKTFTVAANVPNGGTTLPAATQNQPYSQMLTASWGTAPYTWSLIGGALPGGLNLSANGGLSGTPNWAAGSYEFTLWVKDSTAAAAKAQYYQLVVKPTLAVTTAALPPAPQGQSYNQTMTASGGVPPYTWFAHEAGAPTSGLTMSLSGVLSGTPAASGSFTLTITVQDKTGEQTEKNFRLGVNAHP